MSLTRMSALRSTLLVALLSHAFAVSCPSSALEPLWPLPKSVSCGQVELALPESRSALDVRISPATSSVLKFNREWLLKRWFPESVEASVDASTASGNFYAQTGELRTASNSNTAVQPGGAAAQRARSGATRAVLRTITVTAHSASEDLQLGVDESYSLVVDPETQSATIVAKTVFGARNGMETLFQLACSLEPDSSLSFASIRNTPWRIDDAPRFPHRGILLDTSRNFYPMEDLFRLVRALSFSKLNVFHWHIVDSNSFPFESKTFPGLHVNGSYSSREVYHQSEIVALVSYARSLGVRVLPEFDTPGHTFAWGVFDPELIVCGESEPWTCCCAQPPCGQLNPSKEKMWQMLGSLFGEVADVFPDRVLHVGADEVKDGCWSQSEQLQEWMRERGMDSHALLQYFEDREHKMVHALDRDVMVWEEMFRAGIEMDKKRTIVQAWLGADRLLEIASAGYRAVLSNNQKWYLDCGFGGWLDGGDHSWCDPFKGWASMYLNDPFEGWPDTPAADAAKKLVLGGEACMWSEQVGPANVDQKIWPRGAAVAERLWSAHADTQSVDAARPRLVFHRERLENLGIGAGVIEPKWCRLNPGKCIVVPDDDE